MSKKKVIKKAVKKKAAKKVKKDTVVSPDTYQGSKQSAYGGDKPICKNAKCKLRKASCVGFTGCPGFKS